MTDTSTATAAPTPAPATTPASQPAPSVPSPAAPAPAAASSERPLAVGDVVTVTVDGEARNGVVSHISDDGSSVVVQTSRGEVDASPKDVTEPAF